MHRAACRKWAGRVAGGRHGAAGPGRALLGGGLPAPGLPAAQVRRLRADLLRRPRVLRAAPLHLGLQEGRAGARVPAVQHARARAARRDARRGRGRAHGPRLPRRPRAAPAQDLHQQVRAGGVPAARDDAGAVRAVPPQLLPQAPTPSGPRLRRGRARPRLAGRARGARSRPGSRRLLESSGRVHPRSVVAGAAQPRAPGLGQRRQDGAGAPQHFAPGRGAAERPERGGGAAASPGHVPGGGSPRLSAGPQQRAGGRGPGAGPGAVGQRGGVPAAAAEPEPDLEAVQLQHVVEPWRPELRDPSPSGDGGLPPPFQGYKHMTKGCRCLAPGTASSLRRHPGL